MVKIDKILTIPHSPFKQLIDLIILEQVEGKMPFKVSHVNYTEVKSTKAGRRFHVKEAYGVMEK